MPDWMEERRGFELPRPFSIRSVRLRNKDISRVNSRAPCGALPELRNP